MSYWDTGCLVKLYCPEHNSAVFRAHVAAGRTVVTAEHGPLTVSDPEDLIAKIVKGKGKSFRLFYPQDLASAIRQVNQRLGEP